MAKIKTKSKSALAKMSAGQLREYKANLQKRVSERQAKATLLKNIETLKSKSR